MAAVSRIGPFAALTQLGAGGQGEVLLACPWDGRPLRHAATCRLLLGLQRMGRLGPAQARRFRLAALKLGYGPSSVHTEHAHLLALSEPHPHLGGLYSRQFPGVGRDLSLLAPPAAPGRYALALAFVPGVPLDRLLHRRGAPPLAWALTVAGQIALALGRLHERGLVHHDVRPANVIVRTASGKPHAVLVDLGAAELLRAPRAHAVYGVAPYLPPERRGPSPAPPTTAVDIFGLGMLLCAMLAGRSRPRGLAALIGDALEPEPAHRAAVLPTTAVFCERLQRLTSSRGTISSPGRRNLDASPFHRPA